MRLSFDLTLFCRHHGHSNNNNNNSITTDQLLDKTVKAAYSADVAIPNSHNLHSTITQQLQKYAHLKEELITIRQLKMVCTVPLVLSTAGLGRTNYTKSPPSNADSSNTQYMPVFRTTENNKRLVSETGTLLGNGLNCCERREVDDDDNNNNLLQSAPILHTRFLETTLELTPD